MIRKWYIRWMCEILVLQWNVLLRSSPYWGTGTATEWEVCLMAKRYFLESDTKDTIEALKKRWIHGERPVLSFPRTVQIQTLSGCNARCQFCPNGHTVNRLSMGSMSEDLFREIVNDAQQITVSIVFNFNKEFIFIFFTNNFFFRLEDICSLTPC